ncbi:MAG TPA: NAD-dependent epimerase/dehydratase family protein [Acidobacteriota bacterium]|nr:NAD-dependent epimerase/dehydratase family protein [Acidobacteriota bacterium]
MSASLRILVIGGTRFIGLATVRQLLERGCDVTLFHRGETGADLLPDIRRIHGDRGRLADYRAALVAVAPDIVLDMIPLSEADAIAVMDTFRGIARCVVAVSSCDVYRAYGRLIGTEPGEPDPVPISESSPLREKRYPYRGRIPGMDEYDKIPIEHRVLNDPDLPGTVLRLPMVYGPRDRQRRFLRFIKRMADNRPAILFEEQEARWRISFAHVEDVANAIATAIIDPRAAGNIYNVAEPEAAPQIEWARRIAAATGWSGKLVVLPPDRRLGTGDDDFRQHLVIDSSRIRRELDYRETVTQDEAIRQTVAWEHENPPEKYDAGAFDYATEDRLLAEMKGSSR